MSRVVALSARELRSYFLSPVGYIIIALFTLLAGLCAALVGIQIVKRQNRMIEIREAEIFASITEGLTRNWKDPNRDYVTVESRHLWVLAGKSFIYDPTGVPVTFAMSIHNDPVSAAQRAALAAR